MYLIFNHFLKNHNALFQVASNFNGVECVSEFTAPDEPNFTTNYIFDHTQGPAACISAGPGAIARVFYPFYDENTSPHDWNQTESRQINYLDELETHFPVKNGYIICHDDLPQFPSDESDEYDQLLCKMKVGYHGNMEVTNNGLITSNFKDKNHRIDQIICAAMNIGQGSSGARNAYSPSGVRKCQFILDGDYEATYLTAILNRKKVLFLTLLGGGVFGNRLEWIYEAIMKAHKKWANTVESCLERVVVVGYNSEELKSSFRTLLKENNVPYKFLVYMEDEEIRYKDSFGINGE